MKVLLLAFVFLLGFAAVGNINVVYADEISDACAEARRNSRDGTVPPICQDIRVGTTQGNSANANPARDLLNSVIDVMAFIAGALAVIFLIFGGFRYVKSGGDSGKVSEAKNMIAYALIGIIVVVLARQLILFVLNRLL
jgi:hypothetical protein